MNIISAHKLLFRQFAIIIIFMTGALTSIQAQTWELVWADEFDYNGLPDTIKWVNEVGYIRNNELQYYTSRRLENSRVENGNLLIIGRKESYKGANYTSASLTTDGKYCWKYGKIEARIKLPNGQGMWPAFWMLGQNIHEVDWPKCGEIDIMEHINKENKIYGTMHWDQNGHAMYGGNIGCDVEQFHVYSIIWDENSISWLLDGNKYWEGNIKDNINSTDEFHKPFYIILNLAIGGTWPGNPDNSTIYPDTVTVDYVRVYQQKTITTGMLNNKNLINIFPNPAWNSLSIEMPLSFKKTNISIMDLNGRELIKKQLYDTYTQIGIESLAKGIYVLNLTNDAFSVTRKIIKQ